MHASATRLASLLFLSLTLLILAACGGGGSGAPSAGTTTTTTTPTSPNPAATTVYVYNNNYIFFPPGPTTILGFSKSSTGAVSPTSTLTLPTNLILQSLAEDTAGNLFVGGYIATATTPTTTAPAVIDILQYAPGATGTATPVRTISGLATSLEITTTSNFIDALDLDSSGNLYVAAYIAIGSGPTGRSYPGISVFPPSASGNVAPAKIIAGDQTTISGAPVQIAVTPAGTIYVPSKGILLADSLLVFAPAATGNVAPTATIAGPATLLYTIKGVALDTAGNIYVSSLAKPTSTSADSAIPSILVFAPGATGNVAPTRIITGIAANLGSGGTLRVDSTGNLYTLNLQTILKFAPAATGNVAPVSSTTSSTFFTPGSTLAVQ